MSLKSFRNLKGKRELRNIGQHNVNERKKLITHVFSDDTQSPNKISDLLLIKKTNTNDIIITTKPMANVFASCVVDGFKKIRAFNSRQVDSVHVEYLPDFQS